MYPKWHCKNYPVPTHHIQLPAIPGPYESQWNRLPRSPGRNLWTFFDFFFNFWRRKLKFRKSSKMRKSIIYSNWHDKCVGISDISDPIKYPKDICTSNKSDKICFLLLLYRELEDENIWGENAWYFFIHHCKYHRVGGNANAIQCMEIANNAGFCEGRWECEHRILFEASDERIIQHSPPSMTNLLGKKYNEK